MQVISNTIAQTYQYPLIHSLMANFCGKGIGLINQVNLKIVGETQAKLSNTSQRIAIITLSIFSFAMLAYWISKNCLSSKIFSFSPPSPPPTVKTEILENFIPNFSKEEEENCVDQELEFKKLEKIQDIALDHLKQMTSICYNSDGDLNTELLKDRPIFNKLDLKDSLFENEVFNKYANTAVEVEKNLELIFKAYPIKSQTTFYHGTTLTNAEKIKEKGFNPLAPTRTGTDSGAGSYLTEERKAALGYSENKEEGLLSCQIKSPIKIAHLDTEVRECLNFTFRNLVASYVWRNEAAIIKDLKAENIENISLSLDFETRLWDVLFAISFYAWGIEGCTLNIPVWLDVAI